jgi:hypothetical protein
MRKLRIEVTFYPGGATYKTIQGILGKKVIQHDGFLEILHGRIRDTLKLVNAGFRLKILYM